MTAKFVQFEDDGSLPVPRLELVYKQKYHRKDWSCYKVTYRLVLKHLLGNLVGITLSTTKINGATSRPDDQHLPFRDGAHAAHDSTHLDLPVYKIMPGEDPILLDFEHHSYQKDLGHSHRRDLCPLTSLQRELQ